MEMRICFRVTLPGEDGEPQHYGMCLELSCVKEGITYERLASNIDKQALIDALHLTGIVQPEQMELIAPEEFDAEFNEDDFMEVEVEADA